MFTQMPSGLHNVLIMLNNANSLQKLYLHKFRTCKCYRKTFSNEVLASRTFTNRAQSIINKIKFNFVQKQVHADAFSSQWNVYGCAVGKCEVVTVRKCIETGKVCEDLQRVEKINSIAYQSCQCNVSECSAWRETKMENNEAEKEVCKRGYIEHLKSICCERHFLLLSFWPIKILCYYNTQTSQELAMN